MKYTDIYGNICTRYVDHPQVISNFFAGSNVIDTHNQLRQDSLKLEKKWVTQNPWFRLATTLVGINVTDAFLLCNYHQVLNCSKRSDDDQEKKSHPKICRDISKPANSACKQAMISKQ
jgi:hypothetical protein